MFSKGERDLGFPMAYWPFWEGIVVFVAGLLASGLAVALVSSMFTFRTIGQVAAADLIISIALYTVLLGGTYYYVSYQHQAPIQSLGLKTENMGGGIIWGIGIGMLSLVGGISLGYFSRYIFGQPPARDIEYALYSYSKEPINWAYVFLVLIAAAILAPIFEEIFFRGFLYAGLRNKMGIQPALLINAAFFAFVHFEAIGFLPRFFVGYLLGLIYEQRRTLTAPIVAHAVYNASLIMLATYGILQ